MFNKFNLKYLMIIISAMQNWAHFGHDDTKRTNCQGETLDREAI